MEDAQQKDEDDALEDVNDADDENNEMEDEEPTINIWNTKTENGEAVLRDIKSIDLIFKG